MNEDGCKESCHGIFNVLYEYDRLLGGTEVRYGISQSKWAVCGPS